jgi:uroporphyrinogen decarboxylase
VTKRERLQAVMRREPTDRPAYAVWRHFPAVDRSPAALAQSTLRFHERYGSDLLKVTPAAGYAVEDWGSLEGDAVGPVGSRPIARHAIQALDDWKRIRPLALSGSAWGAHVETVLRVVIDRRADCPVMPTVFSPLSLARKLAGGRLGADLREHPQAVADALEVMAEMNLGLAEACFAEGAEGVFYSVLAASAAIHPPEAYDRFGAPHDRGFLEAIRRQDKIAILHAHGERLMFDRLAALTADLWSWDAKRAGPPLREGLAQVAGAAIGGLDEAGTLRHGTPEEVVAQARTAIGETGGLGLVIGPGCVLHANTPDGNLIALARALGGQVKLGFIRPEQ